MRIRSGSSCRLTACLALVVLWSASGCILGSRAIRSPAASIPAAGSPALLALTDSPSPSGKARVRANSGADGVPVDAPGRGTTPGFNGGSGERSNVARRLQPDAIDSGTPRSRGFRAAFQRLEAVLDGTDKPTPPPPPLPRSLVPAGSLGAIRLTAAGKPAGSIGSRVSTDQTSSSADLTPAVTASGSPRSLHPPAALAAVTRIPDVTDWSELNDENSTGSKGWLPSWSHWWMVGIGLVVLGGLARFFARFRRRGGSSAA
ncbi:MAG: hypothetical protein VB859_12220 [Planctomycetaceae bacterium]